MPSPTWRSPAVESRVPKPVFWTFLLLFLISVANVGGLVQRINAKDAALSPIAFCVAAVLVLPLTRARRGFAYLSVAWVFVTTYTIFGFLGPHRTVDFDDYYLAQLTVKLWISVVGVPWLAIRAVDKNRLPTLVRAAVLVVALGAMLAVLQVLRPHLWPVLVSEPGRGSGFWIDANSCGSVCGLFVFASLLFPFRSKAMTFVVRLVLLAGIACTLSRGGILGLAAGTFVYGIAAKRVRTLILISVGVAIFFLTSSLVLDYVGGQSKRLRTRVERVQGMLRGDIKENASARTIIWKYAFDALKKDWLLGRGHGGMSRVVPIGSGLGPHNYYLFVWGNSGLAALLAFLAVLFTLFRYGLRAGDLRSKAAILAMTVMLATYAMVDHAFIANQFMGPLLAIVAISGHYAQKDKNPRRLIPQAMPRPPA
jgi:O-antigen ligase